MEQLVLNGLFGTRESADDLVAQSSLPKSLHDKPVAIYCRDLLTGSTSFADQLVKTLVEERQAAEIILVGAPGRFTKHMVDAAKRRGHSGKVRVDSAADLVS